MRSALTLTGGIYAQAGLARMTAVNPAASLRRQAVTVQRGGRR
jgi:hypothetical protein